MRFTEGPDQTRGLAAGAAAEGFERVAAVGGDGTLSDVGAGLAGTGIPMGIIPAGTGNDLARSLGIPSYRIWREGDVDVWRRQSVAVG